MVVILVTSTRLRSRYALYAHEPIAAQKRFFSAQIATIAAGERPADRNAQESVAYNLTSALLRGGSVAQTTYRAGLETFDEPGVAELAFLVGGYAVAASACNMFDVPVPENAKDAG